MFPTSMLQRGWLGYLEYPRTMNNSRNKTGNQQTKHEDDHLNFGPQGKQINLVDSEQVPNRNVNEHRAFFRLSEKELVPTSQALDPAR